MQTIFDAVLENIFLDDTIKKGVQIDVNGWKTYPQGTAARFEFNTKSDSICLKGSPYNLRHAAFQIQIRDNAFQNLQVT